ncbi:hypothetical protein PHYSODRAFT_326145 [Phytophthora sojae]|uniref:Uncharacterized protein n=1 Tax=Phytophthora sojae (strain P6497) TaxID=1094619 RepID=G4YXT3_PHYSP|nr:hypothetical protein PHYSODRAFT_326145 [Phytophthora sojae]EGZ25076.1 hypothetical protein PHYSODRAFT_326145 [Phytophthora sojae]|eukprot:XP_009520364.1 hypothetical protein PHYSODRAFT_326145 [Phytophthora sojae]
MRPVWESPTASWSETFGRASLRILVGLFTQVRGLQGGTVIAVETSDPMRARAHELVRIELHAVPTKCETIRAPPNHMPHAAARKKIEVQAARPFQALNRAE